MSVSSCLTNRTLKILLFGGVRWWNRTDRHSDRGYSCKKRTFYEKGLEFRRRGMAWPGQSGQSSFYSKPTIWLLKFALTTTALFTFFRRVDYLHISDNTANRNRDNTENTPRTGFIGSHSQPFGPIWRIGIPRDVREHQAVRFIVVSLSYRKRDLGKGESIAGYRDVTPRELIHDIAGYLILMSKRLLNRFVRPHYQICWRVVSLKIESMFYAVGRNFTIRLSLRSCLPAQM